MKLKITLLVTFCAFTATHDATAGELSLDDLFPTDRVLDVQITVSKENWDTIRKQSRNFATALAEGRKEKPLPRPYTYVEASVTIDGVEFPQVGIRKKGFIGSQSRSRPSLKIKLNHVDPESTIAGLNNLTLNNNKQDESLVSQFMGYSLFNAAGSPAPRCAYANVTVNGKNLGVYSHVESMRKPLLKRGFGNDEGTLYEGTVADFYEGWQGSFDRKTGEDETGREKIKQLIDALNATGDTVLVGPDSEARAWVPDSGAFDDKWMAKKFDDSSWVKGRGGAGYDNGSDYKHLLASGFDFNRQLYRQCTSVYLRLPFQLARLKKIKDLILRVKFDDGFVAYLNGHRVASAKAPDKPRWNSAATENNDDRAALNFQSFYISEHIDKLKKGANVLAIHGLNVRKNSSDMLIIAELRSSKTRVGQALAKLVDLDAFYKFWAIESLLGFWDGYSGNKNNFMFYLNPEGGKFHFLPWGADSLFETYSRIDPDRRVPLSVKTSGLIANRLYQQSEGRKRYLKTLTSILDKHWNEKKLLAETDRIEALLTPHVKKARSQRKFSRALKKTRDFIGKRRKKIVKETANGMPIWTKAPSAPILIPVGAGGRDGRDIWTAARNGDIAALEKHLETMDINKKDRMGATALNWAAGLGQIDTVKFLIEKGADVNLRNGDGTTALDGTEKELDDQALAFLEGILRMEIDQEKVNAAKPKIAKLLRKHGAKYSVELTNEPNDIWGAARAGNVESIEKFLATGIDVNAKDLLGSTALSWAAGLGRVDAVKFLISKGADIDMKNAEGKTPLEGTAREMDEAAARFLRQIFKVNVNPKEVNAAKRKIAKILREQEDA